MKTKEYSPEDRRRLFLGSLVVDTTTQWLYTLWLSWILSSLFEFDLNFMSFWIGASVFYISTLMYIGTKFAAEIFAAHTLILICATILTWIIT